MSSVQKNTTVSVSEQLLLTIPQAARRLSTTTWAVRELLWGKKVRYIRLGRRFLIDPADLAKFIKAEKRVWVPPPPKKKAVPTSAEAVKREMGAAR